MKRIAAVGLSLMLASAAAGRVLCLDLGPADAPVAPGFQALTASDAAWSSESPLEAVDVPVPREPFPPPIYTTDLRRDSVQSRGTATLHLDLPAGAYRAWLMIGTGGGGWSQVWNLRVTNSAAGSSTEATFFGGYTARVMELDITADDHGAVLRFETKSRWSVNAIIVAPRDQWDHVRASLFEPWERSITLLPDDVLKDWTHTPHVETTPELDYTAQELERGYVLHQRPWVEPVWPNTNPHREQTNVRLRAMLSPNEYEPITFTILPLRDVGPVSLDLTDLRSDTGQVIPATDIERRFVQYKIVRSNYKAFGTYYRAPDLLPRFDHPQPLTPRENFRVWLTVHARQGTPPGIYRGQVTLRFGGSETQTLPLEVEVLPIDLKTDSSVTYSTYYRHPLIYLSDAPDEFSRQWWQRKIESDAASMAAHGYNGFRLHISADILDDGSPRVDLTTAIKQLDIARRHGMDVDRPVMVDLRQAIKRPYTRYTGKQIELHYYNIVVPPDAFYDEVAALVSAVEAERRRLGLPEFLYSLADEPRQSDESIRFVHGLYAAARRTPDVRTYLTTGGAHMKTLFDQLGQVVDVWAVQQIQLEDTLPRAELAKFGVELWCYPNAVAGENDHTPVAGARMTYGFASWRYGCPGLIPWIFESWSGDPGNNLDALQMEFFNQTSDDGELIPCVLYEAYREGIDDHRYITTLTHAIAQARATGRTAKADAAQQELDRLRASIPSRQIYQYDTGWSPHSFDAARWAVIRAILALQTDD